MKPRYSSLAKHLGGEGVGISERCVRAEKTGVGRPLHLGSISSSRQISMVPSNSLPTAIWPVEDAILLIADHIGDPCPLGRPQRKGRNRGNCRNPAINASPAARL
jgi:hypothetical protein